MRLTFHKQLTTSTQLPIRFLIVGFLASVVLAGTIQAQDQTPGYAPGSVLTTSILAKNVTEEPAEVGIWTPPETQAPGDVSADGQSSSSAWVPPETPVKPTRPEVGEVPFEEELGKKNQGNQKNELLIEPAEDQAKLPQKKLELPAEPAIAESMPSEALPNSVNVSPQTPPVLPLPSASASVVTEYDFPQDSSMAGACESDVIIFDDNCFAIDASEGVCEPEMVIQESDVSFPTISDHSESTFTPVDSFTPAESFPSPESFLAPAADCENCGTDGFPGEGCECESCEGPRVPRSIIRDNSVTPFKQPKLGGKLLDRTVQAGKNVVSKGRSIANNAKLGQPNVLGRQRIHTPVRGILGNLNQRLTPNNEAVHAVGQLTFLSFARDYRGRGRQLSQGVPSLFSNGVDEGSFTGVDLSYGRRRGGGKGWEMRYIGFNPDAATDVSGNVNLVWGGFAPPLNDPATWGGFINPNTPQTFGLSGLGLNGTSMADVFGDALNHRVTRDSEFGSFEVNFLRAGCGRTRLSCGGATVELFGGLRGVAFHESMNFEARATQTPGFPSSAIYSSEVRNSLFGLQIGGRMERHKAKGWGYSFGTRVGIYNNRVENRQRAEFVFDDGSRPTPTLLFGDDAGQEFDFQGTNNELAFLGELDFGLIYQFRPQTRARFGYRGIVVTNVATAADQLEDSLFDVDAVTQPRAIGDFIVGGLYFGVDHAF